MQATVDAGGPVQQQQCACARTRYTDSSGRQARCTHARSLVVVASTPRKAKPQATAMSNLSPLAGLPAAVQRTEKGPTDGTPVRRKLLFTCNCVPCCRARMYVIVHCMRACVLKFNPKTYKECCSIVQVLSVQRKPIFFLRA